MIIANLSKVRLTASIQEKDVRFVCPDAEVNVRFAMPLFTATSVAMYRCARF